MSPPVHAMCFLPVARLRVIGGPACHAPGSTRRLHSNPEVLRLLITELFNEEGQEIARRQGQAPEGGVHAGASV